MVGLLAEVMKGGNVSMGVKKGLRNSILLPALTYGQRTGHGKGRSSRECVL